MGHDIERQVPIEFAHILLPYFSFASLKAVNINIKGIA